MGTRSYLCHIPHHRSKMKYSLQSSKGATRLSLHGEASMDPSLGILSNRTCCMVLS
jgi:hypothetical protein